MLGETVKQEFIIANTASLSDINLTMINIDW